MYYLIEIDIKEELQFSKALTRKEAQEKANEIYEEYMANCEAGGIVPDIAIVIHQCIQVIEFKPKGE
jgi:hypothetical protein